MNLSELHAREDRPCLGKPLVWFIPDTENNKLRASRDAKAKAICEKCPVIAECREIGLYERTGTWGGLTESERAMVRRNRTGMAS